MKGSSALLIALAGLLLATGVAGASMNSRRDQGPVSTVAHLLTQLKEDPRAWANRRVLVRGIAGGCIPWAAPKDSPCVDEQPELLQMDATGIVAALPVSCGQVPPLPGFLRRLPWIGRSLPAPQVLHPGTLAVYWIQLPAILGYNALLVDSMPSCGDE